LDWFIRGSANEVSINVLFETGVRERLYISPADKAKNL
jgi:hypothetical protein